MGRAGASDDRRPAGFPAHPAARPSVHVDVRQRPQHPGQHFDAGVHVRLSQSSAHLTQHSVLPGDHRLDHAAPGLRQPDQRRPPVHGVRHRLHEPALGGLVHHPLHELPAQRLRAPHLRHRHGPVQPQEVEHGPDPDARGHGDSTNATAAFRHTDDVAALVRHLDAGPAVLVGVSMGAATATDTALEHPELVRAVVVSGAGTSEPEFADGWTGETLAAFWSALFDGDMPRALKLWNNFTAGPGRPLTDLDPAIPALIEELTVKTLMKHAADEPDWSRHPEDTWARAAKLAIPVLAVIGGADSPDHRAQAERLAESVAGGRKAVIPDAAHYPNLEHPAQFDAIISEFIDGLDGLDGLDG
ncbi:MAG: alpha/beta hydrolase [Catenulispora sp.]|nr:alpha/beta hydrolase [Catenulispora sp.]